MEVDFFKVGLGYGILIWLIMFLLVSALIGYNFYQDFWLSKFATPLVAGLLSLFFAFLIRPKDLESALTYGMVWLVVGIALDVFLTRTVTKDIFLNSSYWMGYALIALVPALATKHEKTA